MLHVDLDQFIAAVEVLRHPELRGRPVVVGGRGDPTERGVVSTASYEARAFNVHSGLPLRTAARRCPEAVFLPVDREEYDAASDAVMATLRTFGVVVEVLGWDEAFLAVDAADARYGDDPEKLAGQIRARVHEATGLDCSVGIGQNKLQAKLATGFGKPAGVFRLTDQTWMEVLGDRPTDALWGVGAKTAARLREVGVETVRHLAAADPQVLAGRFGPTIGPWLVDVGNGRGSARVVGTPHVARSRSREVTYQQNLEDWDEVRAEVAKLARLVTADVEAGQRQVARVVVKVRHAPFFTSTHGQAVVPPSLDVNAIELAATAALDQFTDHRPVRLLGVRAELVR